jgi:hypothetical protein
MGLKKHGVEATFNSKTSLPIFSKKSQNASKLLGGRNTNSQNGGIVSRFLLFKEIELK